MQEALEAQMTAVLGTTKSERTADRQGYRSGYYERGLVSRVGELELRVPQDRDGRFSTEPFERDRRSEKALVEALAEIHIQGVSARKVEAITEELSAASRRPRSVRSTPASTRAWQSSLEGGLGSPTPT